THKEVITGKTDSSDCILGGSISQLEKIAQKMQLQPFGLKDLGKALEEKIQIKEKQIKTKIIGILNVTKNSFSDGGDYYEYEDSITHLHELIDEGADIIDIGAESTKPGAIGINAEEQIKKIVPILEYINKNNIKIPISIDTRSTEVAQKCIELGASIINDVSGFDFDNTMPDTIAKNPHVKIIIQHSNGTPDVMQNSPYYENLMDDIYKSLSNKVKLAVEKGIKKENIIIDPGIGFGKTKENNFEIIRRWQELKTIGCPILIGISRKSLLGMTNSTNQEKDIYTLALNSILINKNIDYIRVHNVRLHKQLLNLL
ncbi:dihydropteroate synthase, partial [bacterium]|nr:dihydropteroate synthase [bacterium]